LEPILGSFFHSNRGILSRPKDITELRFGEFIEGFIRALFAWVDGRDSLTLFF